jgi:predicted AlkP superfamily pyrophosphatase or phosphodiesterase
MLDSLGLLRRVLLTGGLWLIALAGSAAAQPRLVVVIVVDQMRASFLDEFAADYRDGFRRLRAEGAVFLDAHQDHALTETSPGHATIATGAYPSHHGVVGNDIWDRQTRTLVGTVLDDASRMVGTERRSGRSPHRLMRSTLGDWLKQQSPRSKVFSVSLKDRSAVLSAGLRPDGAYWYDERTGNFVTSDYYHDELPGWLTGFNAAKHADAYFGTSWLPVFSDRDPEPVGDTPAGAARYSAFPHVLAGDGASPDRRYYTRLRLTPFADRLTLDLAEALIEAEDLGGDEAPDLLAVALSAADYIGHRYGPWSDEVRDYYGRLDGYLGELLSSLDARVGAGGYAFVLTADHGVMPMPERIEERSEKAGRMHPDEILAFVEPVVAGAARRNEIPAMPTLRYEHGVIFDFGAEPVREDQLDALARAVAAELAEHPFVAGVYTHAQLRAGHDDDSPWYGRVERSFYPDRAPDVVVVTAQNHLITEEAANASHGSPYAYDSHVPLVFVGPGMKTGEYAEPVRTVDIAPTLAAWLAIEPPADLDGRDLSPVLWR